MRRRRQKGISCVLVLGAMGRKENPPAYDVSCCLLYRLPCPTSPPESANLAANESAARFTRLRGRDQKFRGLAQNTAYDEVFAVQLSFHFAGHSSNQCCTQNVGFWQLRRNLADSLGPSPTPGGRGGGWHKASVSDCVPLAAPIGLSPLLILTLCGPERVLVVSTEPPDDLSCLTTPGVGRPGDVPLTRCRGGGGGTRPRYLIVLPLAVPIGPLATAHSDPLGVPGSGGGGGLALATDLPVAAHTQTTAHTGLGATAPLCPGRRAAPTGIAHVPCGGSNDRVAASQKSRASQAPGDLVITGRVIDGAEGPRRTTPNTRRCRIAFDCGFELVPLHTATGRCPGAGPRHRPPSGGHLHLRHLSTAAVDDVGRARGRRCCGPSLVQRRLTPTRGGGGGFGTGIVCRRQLRGGGGASCRPWDLGMGAPALHCPHPSISPGEVPPPSVKGTTTFLRAPPPPPCPTDTSVRTVLMWD